MTPSPHPEFKVDVSRAAVAQWRNLVKRAQAIGAATEVRQAMREAIEALQTDPERFGDPLYRTKLSGGHVCRGIRAPLSVRFAILRNEKAVLVIEIQPVPASALDQQE
jgi:hypothetical protein